MMRRTNPFDRYELTPTADVAELTDALRERAERADPSERADIRAAWELLTLHPARRLELALTAVPETRAPLGGPPPRLPLARWDTHAPLGLEDLIDAPSAVAALDPPDEAERALLAPRCFLTPLTAPGHRPR
jgi:hypothetical protein